MPLDAVNGTAGPTGDTMSADSDARSFAKRGSPLTGLLVAPAGRLVVASAPASEREAEPEK